VTASLDARFTGLEIVDLTGSGNNTLNLTVGDVLDLSDTTNTLRVDGNPGDKLTSTGQAWAMGDVVDIGGVSYQTYVKGAATLLADTDLTLIVS
jgi:hypothetical protein